MTAIGQKQNFVSSITIANGASNSSAFQPGYSPSGKIVIPAAFTGTSIKYQGADTAGGTFSDLYDWNNQAISHPVTAGKRYAIPLEALSEPFVRVVSDATEGAERTIIYSLRA